MPALLMAILITVLDQLSKYWVTARMAFGETRTVIPGFFNLVYVRNTGAAWGLMSGHNELLALLALLMLGLLLVFRRVLSEDGRHHHALGILAGGILGNLMDRLRLGWVADFADFHLLGWHWPAFNIADAAICTAIGLYLLSSWRGHGMTVRGRGGALPAEGAEYE